MTLHTLNSLLTRRSTKLLCAPAPNQDELDAILQCAMVAPDHGSLRPWRFALIRGEAVGRLACMALEAVKASGEKRMTAEKERSVRAWLAEVPLVIAVAQRLNHHNTKIPEAEQLLAVGASVMNILNATHMLGYGAFWSTGLGTYVEAVQDALGFDALDYKFLGFLAIGTVSTPLGPAKRAPFSDFVTEWTGVRPD